MEVKGFPDCKFHVDPSGLHRPAAVRCLKAENAYYKAFLYYYGDYDDDWVRNVNLRESLTVSVRLQHPGFELRYLGGVMMLRVDDTFDPRTPLRKIYDQLYIARHSAILLNKLLEKYFPATPNPDYTPPSGL